MTSHPLNQQWHNENKTNQMSGNKWRYLEFMKNISKSLTHLEYYHALHIKNLAQVGSSLTSSS